MYCKRTDINLITGAELYRDDSYVVYINGNVLGVTRFPVRFVQSFRRLRRNGRISEFVSIYTNNHHHTVHIASDGGRICRPMIIVENMQSRVTSEHIKVSFFSLPQPFLHSHLYSDIGI